MHDVISGDGDSFFSEQQLGSSETISMPATPGSSVSANSTGVAKRTKRKSTVTSTQSSSSSQYEQLLKRAIEVVEKPEQPRVADEADAFGLYVSSQMRNFSRDQSARFQREVMALVWKYQDENQVSCIKFNGIKSKCTELTHYSTDTADSNCLR